MSNMNQHKRMAMGEKVTGMKKGGSVKPKRPGLKMAAMPMPVAAMPMPPGGADLDAASQGGMKRGGKVMKKAKGGRSC